MSFQIINLQSHETFLKNNQNHPPKNNIHMHPISFILSLTFPFYYTISVLSSQFISTVWKELKSCNIYKPPPM